MVDWAKLHHKFAHQQHVDLAMPARLRFAILASIQAGDLPPGTSVKEAVLADALQVSRTPLREALAVLKAEQILEMDREGLRVRKLKWRDITALYELRATLEAMAAGLAAHHATSAERQIIDQICTEEKALAAADTSPARLAVQNQRFHQAILQASGNQFLGESLARVTGLMVLTGATAYRHKARVAAIQDEHQHINHAIQNAEPDKAEIMMKQHLRNALIARLNLLSLTEGSEID